MRKLLTTVICCAIAYPVLAKGKISGNIKDENTGEALIGVSVILKQKGNDQAVISTMTDIDGYYLLETDAGNYELELEYIGYNNKTITDIAVADGKATQVPVLFNDRNTAIDEVVIRSTARNESINALYTSQKNAIAVSSGISADLIKRSPDKNTGEVLKRVSGASVQDNKFVVVRGLSDRYNAALINNTLMPTTEPNRKAFSFDIIPSNLIDNLVINKTATPDLPGDFAGGVIKITTKDVPDQNFVNLNISLGYNTQSTFKDFTSNGHSGLNNLGFDNKNRKLDAAFGDNYQYYKGLSPSEQENVSQKLDNNFKEKTNKVLPVQSYQLSWGNGKYFKNGDKLGSVIALNYRKSESIYNVQRRRLIADYTWNYDFPQENRNVYSVNTGVMANFSYLTGKTKISFKNIYNQLYDDVYFSRNGYNVSNVQQQQIFSSAPMERGLINTQLEGDHAFGANSSKISWNLAYSRLGANQNDLRTAFYSRAFTSTNDKVPEEIPSLPYELVDRNSRRFFSKMVDNNYAANLNYTTYFNLFNQKQTFKAGYNILSRNRDFNSRIFNYQASDLANFNNDLNRLPVGEIFDQANIGRDGFVLSEFTNPTDAYTVNGLLNAGYLMFDNKFTEKLRVIWGARVEQYSQKLNIRNQSAIEETLQQSYLDILPSLNVSYSLNEKSNLRFAAARTVSRPEFWEIAPFSFYDFDNNWVMDGNPDLNRTNITNVDLRYELYPQAGEAITIAAFYKHFNNPIETYLQSISGDADYISYFNSKSARSIGVELEIRKNLGFIHDSRFFKNITLGGNVAYINSQVNMEGFAGASDRPMMGQSPYLLNLTAQYADDDLGFSATILYNRIGQRIAVVGNGTRPNIFENGRDLLDIQLSKAVLNKKGEVKLTVGDLLNSPYMFYQDMNGDNKAFQRNDGTLNAKNGDSIFRTYKMGTNVSLGFSYNFLMK